MLSSIIAWIKSLFMPHEPAGRTRDGALPSSHADADLTFLGEAPSLRKRSSLPDQGDLGSDASNLTFLGEPPASARRSAPPDYGSARFGAKLVLTPREQSCYWLLDENIDKHFRVLPQVAFSAFLRVSGGTQKQNYALFGTARQKVADFLIVRPDFSVVALIELDDRSHDSKKEQDRQRDAIVKSAGILVFRFPNAPDAEFVRRISSVLLKREQGG